MERIVETKIRERLRAESNPVLAYFDVGYEALIEGEHERALLCFRKCLELDPDFGLARQAMGILYAELGNDGEAIRCFQACIDAGCKGIDPAIEEENPYFHMGWCHENLGDPLAAEQAYKKGLERVPQHYKTHLRLGAMYHRQHRYEEAIRSYEAAIEACNQMPMGFFSQDSYEASKQRKIDAILVNLQRARNGEDYATPTETPSRFPRL